MRLYNKRSRSNGKLTNISQLLHLVNICPAFLLNLKRVRSKSTVSRKSLQHASVLCEHKYSRRRLVDLSAAEERSSEKLPSGYHTNHQLWWVLYWEPCRGHCWFEDGGLNRSLRENMTRAYWVPTAAWDVQLKDEAKVMGFEEALRHRMHEIAVIVNPRRVLKGFWNARPTLRLSFSLYW